MSENATTLTKVKTLIAMDAPPDKENCEPFVKINKLLSDQNIHTPHIYAQSAELGFLLLEDLGSTDYLSKLTSPSSANTLYEDAINTLIKLQHGPTELISPYTPEKLREEMGLFPTWFISKHLGHELNNAQKQAWESTQRFLCAVCQEQPQVWVHRDFHSRNLMVTTSNNPGVIDFQDMLNGPIAYDLASIFKDCYIEWPRKQQLVWLENYYHKLNAQTSTPQHRNLSSFTSSFTDETFSFEELVRWYDLTGLQRHLKVLGIFCRLNYRDGKPQYLADLALVAKYCIEVLAIYPELEDFKLQFQPFIEKACHD